MLRFVVRLALAAAPAAYRREYCDAIAADLADVRRTRGVVAMLAALADVVRSALLERCTSTGAALAQTIRSLARTPLFTTIAVVTLAVGIAVNLAVFAIVNAVLLRPLPLPHADQLLTVQTVKPFMRSSSISEPNAADLLRSSMLGEGTTFTYAANPALSGYGPPKILAQWQASPTFFSVLGLRAMLGRAFTPADAGTSIPLAVVNERTWQLVFAASPSIVGRHITLDGASILVIGVADLRPFEAVFGEADVVELPRVVPTRRGDADFTLVVRRQPGASLAQINADAKRIGDALERAYPGSNRATSFRFEPLIDLVVGDVRSLLTIIWIGVGAVLLIGCANVGNMLLARASSRRREMAVRIALGATRFRVFAYFLAESSAIAVLAGVLGIALSIAAIDAFVALRPGNIPRLDGIAIAPEHAGYAVIVIALVALLCGAIPAMAFGGRSVVAGLQDGGRGTTGRGRLLRSGLVGMEIALTLALVVNAASVVGTFAHMLRFDLGFVDRGVTLVDVPNLPEPRYSDVTRRAFYHQLLARVRAFPGIERAALTSLVPLSGDMQGTSYQPDDRPAPAADALSTTFVNVSPAFFETLEAPVIRGRSFTDADERAGTAMIVSESFAERAFPHVDPIGHRVTTGIGIDPHATRTVIGVVRDISYLRFDGSWPAMFVTGFTVISRHQTLMIRSSTEPAALLAQVTAAIKAIDPSLVPPDSVDTLAAVVDRSKALTRAASFVFATTAAIAIAIALAGIYGVMSYEAAQRTREIGIRVALGARPIAIVARLTAGTAVVALCGIGVGLAVGLAFAGRFGQSLQTEPLDALSLVALCAAVAACALAAAYVPARRAARIDPMIALRFE